MIGMGTIINTGSIVAGGLIGNFAGKLFKEAQQEALSKTCGISVVFISIAGAMEGMLKMQNGGLHSVGSMLVVICLVLGSIVGEWIGIEDVFERFGEWLKQKSGNSGS